jgi:radical SAM superfamily enzyme YgiQ (UPF0313 family)
VKVALVQMPVWWTIDPPLGLAQMAGCLKAAGHEPVVFDANIQLWNQRSPAYANMWLWEQFHFWNNPAVVDRFFSDNAVLIEKEVEDLLRTDARVVGFSVAYGSQLASLRAAKLVKEADPSRVVVFGGQQFFFDGKAAEILRDPSVDAVIRGNADEVFPALAGDVERTGRIRRRPGIVFRAGGAIVDEGPAPGVTNLDRVPFADFTGFPMDLYTDADRLPMAASRGCVWACRFCSSRAFWDGYSYMSGDRIFAEVLHHRRLFPRRRHIDFYDITANGRPETLRRFAQLVKEHDWYFRTMEIGWKINAVLRPEMTADYLKDLHEGGCKEVIYGVESGSPRVLKLMNKNYDVTIAERVLRDTRAAGITTTGNFMFGFPGETEDDFQMTLDFLRRNADSFDRAYASATFTSLEDHSYLTEHQADFGIKKSDQPSMHALYWESEDGSNTYPVRVDRYVRFRQLAIRLGLEAYKGINGDLEQERLANLAHYHRSRDERFSAARAFQDYLEIDPHHEPMTLELEGLLEDLEKLPALCRELDEWERRHSLPDETRRTVWDFMRARLTDDNPFSLAALPELGLWLSDRPEVRSAVEELAAFHAGLQKLRHRAVLRLDGGRFRVYYGREAAPSPEAIKDLLNRTPAKAAAGVAG